MPLYVESGTIDCCLACNTLPLPVCVCVCVFVCLKNLFKVE